MLKKKTLESGLRFLFYPMADTEAVTILVMLSAGSKYEEKEESGIAHLLEHNFFKGTKNRPTTFDIARELDAVGGAYNAFTSKDVIGFWVKASSRHLDIAADVLSDMLFNSLFDPEEMEKEKKVVFEEINMIEDDPQRYVFDLFEKLLYGDQPAGRMIIGTKETVAGISSKKLVDYFKNKFSSENTVIAISGNFKESEAEEKIEKVFDNFFRRTAPRREMVSEEQTKPELLLFGKSTEQSHLCLGVRTENLSSPDRYPLMLISSILGGSMSSRLSVEVRQKRGLCYYVTSFLEQNPDTGYLVSATGVDNRRIKEAIEVILSEYKRLKTEKVSEEELKRTKDGIRGHLSLSLETSDAWAAYLASQELLENKVSLPEEECAKIDAVTPEDILRVSQKIFVPEKLNLAMISPFEKKEEFENLLKL